MQRESRLPHGGRGMELSELEWYFGHLLTPDDHTGQLLEVLSPRGRLDARVKHVLYGQPSNVSPTTFRRATLFDGDGKDETSVFKAEWMVIKDDVLMVGGHGRSYTFPEDGTRVKNHNAKWIKLVTMDFKVRHMDWSSQFDAIAQAVGVSFPGYLMHEAVLWSQQRKEWIFLPRRLSKDAFDPEKNERRGSNTVILASDDFKNISVVSIEGLKDATGLRGFSSAKFVPGTNDRIVAAIRTIEVETGKTPGKGRETASFISVFEVATGRMLIAERNFSAKKFEGLVFL